MKVCHTSCLWPSLFWTLCYQVDTTATEVGGQDVSRMKDVLIQLKSSGLPGSSA